MSPRARAIATADRVVRSVRAQAEAVVALEDRSGRRTLVRLLRSLREADSRLTQRMHRIASMSGGAESTFTGAQASMYRTQIREVIAQVQHGLLGHVTRASEHAIRESLDHATGTIARLEEAFTGIATTVRLREASLFEGMVSGASASLLRRHERSAVSYGHQLLGGIEREMAQGMLTGATQHEVVERIVERAGFGREAWRAWRIVRTETAYAYAETQAQSIAALREDFPDMRRVIVASFDSRTAWDSVVVHGQVRRIDEPFTDGVGRVYLNPPGRPNDREVTIPWRPTWPSTPSTTPISPARRAQLRTQIRQRAERPRRRHVAA